MARGLKKAFASKKYLETIQSYGDVAIERYESIEQQDGTFGGIRRGRRMCAF
jgi:hypothetical protein